MESTDQKTEDRLPVFQRTWVRVTGVVGGLALFLGLISNAWGVGERIVDFFFPGDPETREECIDRAESGSESETKVDTWYCQVEFSLLWEPGREPHIVRENRDEILTRLPLIMQPTGDYPDSPEEYLTEGIFTSDLPPKQGQLSRLFHDWPTYQAGTSMVNGSILNVNGYDRESTHSEWVFQIGTSRDPSVALHLLVVESSEWTPPNESECQGAFAEITPIARGYGSSTTGHSVDVIYGVASSFACFPFMEDESEAHEMLENLIDGNEEIREEIMEEYEKGTNTDRW